MPGENIQDWSTSATLNGNADSGINWAEGQPRASVNNSSRSMMAAHAKDRNLKNGSIITSGAADAQTFFSGLDYTTIPTGLRVTLKIGPSLTNTGAATLNMDGIGAVAIKDQDGTDIAAGTLLAGSFSDFLYDGTNWITFFATTSFVETAIAAAALTNIRVFTSSGTYPTTTATCKVVAYAKGGGGGGAASLSGVGRGGGGGEGAEGWLLTTAAALSGLAITIGAGGTQDYVGNPGATTSVGTLLTAPGGLGAAGGHFGGAGGTGGAIGTCTYGMPGAAGQTGADNSGSLFGINANGGGKGGGPFTGNGAANSGGGGGGGTNAIPGGNGGSGIVVFYEYGTI